MRFLYVCLLLNLFIPAFSQTAEQIKKAQEQIDKLTPEQKKMMEQMGISTDPMKMMPKGAEANQAVADANNYVPKKNEAGIAMANKTVLTNSNLAAFITNTHATVTAKLKPASKTLGEKIFRQLKAENKSANEIGNEAAGLWMAGRIEPALYLIGKASEMDPMNVHHLNNYASMLSMCGAPQYAIPMLNKLNAEMPQNSTILNNLGQAWFGLGDLDKAGKYLDSTIKRYAFHPQAHMTKAAIEEKKGNNAAAIDHVKKSIQHAFTPDKQNKLRKLGVKLNASDIRFHPPFKPDSDPLGLHKFSHPPIPKSTEEQVLYAGQWNAHREEIINLINGISQKQQAYTNPKAQQMMQNAQNYSNKKPVAAGDADKPMLYPVGKIMLDAMDKDGGAAFRLNSSEQALKQYQQVELKKLKAEYEAEVKKLDQKDEAISKGLKKEGGDEREGLCEERKQLLDKYLATTGARFEELYNSYLKQLSLTLNEEIYWKQYMQWPDDFEITKFNAQTKWLGALTADFGFMDLTKPALSSCPFNRKANTAGNKLPDFDVVNCNMKSELYLFVGSIKIDCNVMTTKFKLAFLELGLKQDMNKADFGDSFQGCTVKISEGIKTLKEIKIDEVDYGAGIEAGIEFEFDRTGLKDVTASVGLNAVNNGAELKVSLVSGKVSTEVQTMFDNIPGR
jgi:Flp pilus assembly protein TadD